MHVVECPSCHRRFKVPSPMREAAMRCNRCGNSFVGSSVEAPDAPLQAPDAPLQAPATPAPPAQGPRLPAVRPVGSSPTTVMMAVVSFFGLVGVIALVAVLVVRLRDDSGGTGPASRSAIRAARRPRPPRRGGARLDGRRTPPASAPTRPAAPASIGDPKLIPGRPVILSSGPGRGGYHACGSLSVQHDKPLRSVTVRAEVDGVSGEPVIYDYVAPNSVILYSVPLPGKKVAETRVNIVAVGVPAGEGTIAWTIDPTDVGKAEPQPDGEVVWRGSTQNPLATPAKKVMIYCDFFFSEGIQAGSAVGKVTGNGIVGAGKHGYFRVVSEDASLANCEVCVARAVGQEY